MKSVTEQGTALFLDRDHFATCPVHAIAIAVIMQTVPCADLLGHIPIANSTPQQTIPDNGMSLLDSIACQSTRNEANESTAKNRASPGIHAYVNRLLSRVVACCMQNGDSLTKGLTSHSFRRGAAQNANGDAKLSPQWILDRGGWSLSSLSKGFAYITNTTKEDQKVGKSLTGWDHDQSAKLPNYSGFDPVVLKRVITLQNQLFRHVKDTTDEDHSLRSDVIEVFTACVVMNFSQMMALNEDGPFVQHFKNKMRESDLSMNEILCWSLTIRSELMSTGQASSSIQASQADQPHSNESSMAAFFREQSALMHNLLEENIKLQRQTQDILSQIRGSLEGQSGIDSSLTLALPSVIPALVNQEPAPAPAKKRKTNTRKKNLKTVWFEWFDGQMWDAQISRQRLHEFKLVVAYLKLFIPSGFDLRRDDLLGLGQVAESNAIGFLATHGYTAASYGTAVVALKALHRSGKMSELIATYKSLHARGLAVDTAPESAQFKLL